MSSYDPLEKEDTESSHDPGVKEKEIAKERNFSATLGSLSERDYITFGALLGIPASGLTMILVMYFFPGFADTAEGFLRWLWALLIGLLS